MKLTLSRCPLRLCNGTDSIHVPRILELVQQRSNSLLLVRESDCMWRTHKLDSNSRQPPTLDVCNEEAVDPGIASPVAQQVDKILHSRSTRDVRNNTIHIWLPSLHQRQLERQ